MKYHPITNKLEGNMFHDDIKRVMKSGRKKVRR
jgi:hypothetical protein